MKTRQGQAGVGEGQPVGEKFWLKVGQRLHRRGQGRAGQGRARQGKAGQGLPEVRDGAGMRQAWERNQNGWSRVGLTGEKRLEQGSKQK